MTKSERKQKALALQNQQSTQMFKYGPLFSFFDYYQDFVNDLGAFADLTGKIYLLLIFDRLTRAQAPQTQPGV
jgi:hypothetical protein